MKPIHDFPLLFVPAVLALVASPETVRGQASAPCPDPIVIEGKRLPGLLGVTPGHIVAFAFRDKKWRQIPVQIDERARLKFGRVLGRHVVRAREAVFYCDPKTYTGSDPDHDFDKDDELVLLLADCGQAAPAAAPAGVNADSRVELRVEVPGEGTNAPRFAYLFESLGKQGPGSSRLTQSAGRDDVSYEFRLKSGEYKKTYELGQGANPEASMITTAAYRLGFSDRWLLDELRLHSGAVLGVDILDGHKVELVPGNCLRSTRTFSDGPGAIIANIDGPVRAIRSIAGANSGPLTERLWICYRRRFDIVTHLRVHALPSSFSFFDYSKDAIGMRYFDNNNYEGKKKDGVVIDGKPDEIRLGELRWQLVSGAPGSILIHYLMDTSFKRLKTGSLYDDAMRPKWKQCTGDAHALGVSGVLTGRIPNTDRRVGRAGRLTSRIVVYPGAPNVTPGQLGTITAPRPLRVRIR